MSIIFITGTDTGVGKTIVTAALAALARASGRRVAVVKAVQTGVATDEPGDLDEVRRLAGIDDLHELARFSDPLAPATAARRANLPAPAVAQLAACIRGLVDRDLVLVEGGGGLLVHLDAAGGTLADLAGELDAPAIVVAHAGLGTLNASALTCEALGARRVECLGLVIGAWPAAPDLAATSNLDDLPAYTGQRVLGRLPEGAATLAPDAFLEVAKAWIDAELQRLLA